MAKAIVEELPIVSVQKTPPEDLVEPIKIAKKSIAESRE